MRRYFGSKRSQAMPEFALTAPILFLIIFGIFDLGRGVMAYVAIQHAANEGARVAVQGVTGIGGVAPYVPPCTLAPGDVNSNCSLTTDAGVIDATIADTGAVKLTAPPSCPNGPLPAVPTPLTATNVPTNTGWVYVSEPEAITSSGWVSPAVTNNGPAPANNAPGGDNTTKDTATCFGSSAASGAPLQVTVIYHFTLTVPKLLGIPSSLTLVAWSVYETEY